MTVGKMSLSALSSDPGRKYRHVDVILPAKELSSSLVQCSQYFYKSSSLPFDVTLCTNLLLQQSAAPRLCKSEPLQVDFYFVFDSDPVPCAGCPKLTAHGRMQRAIPDWRTRAKMNHMLSLYLLR